MKKDERGVSETIGFVILLSLTVTGISLVTLYGYPTLLSEQQSANVANMERTFISVQNEIKSLAYKNVPYREMTFQVSGGTVSVQQVPDPNLPKFEVFYGSNNSPIRTLFPGNISYTSDNEATTISLENGAVMERFGGTVAGSTVIAPPRWIYDDSTKTYIIPLIYLDATESVTKKGITTLQMKLVNFLQDDIDISGQPLKVWYHADPENNFNTAWNNTFSDSSLQMTKVTPPSALPYSDGLNSVFSLNPAAERLIINRYYITVIGM